MTSARDRAKYRTGNLRGVNQPGPCTYADRYPAERVGVTGGAVYERQKFSQVAERIRESSKTLQGPVFVDAWLLGRNEWQCDG